MPANQDAKPCKRKLTDSLVRVTKPHKDGKPRNYSDGGGLYLHVKPSGKFWRYNYRFPKQKTLSIGTYPEIPLKLARERHENGTRKRGHCWRVALTPQLTSANYRQTGQT